MDPVIRGVIITMICSAKVRNCDAKKEGIRRGVDQCVLIFVFGRGELVQENWCKEGSLDLGLIVKQRAGRKLNL